jgi:hypothetical protein
VFAANLFLAVLLSPFPFSPSQVKTKREPISVA